VYRVPYLSLYGLGLVVTLIYGNSASSSCISPLPVSDITYFTTLYSTEYSMLRTLVNFGGGPDHLSLHSKPVASTDVDVNRDAAASTLTLPT
jgi:hypothetical protein